MTFRPVFQKSFLQLSSFIPRNWAYKQQIDHVLPFYYHYNEDSIIFSVLIGPFIHPSPSSFFQAL